MFPLYTVANYDISQLETIGETEEEVDSPSFFFKKLYDNK